jgi:hypothetical protein
MFNPHFHRLTCGPRGNARRRNQGIARIAGAQQRLDLAVCSALRFRQRLKPRVEDNVLCASPRAREAISDIGTSRILSEDASVIV